MHDNAFIPQANPGAGYRALKQGIDAAVLRVLESGWYILGQEVEAFEREYAAWLGLPHSLGVANGTDAIELALRGLGIGAGDLVFTVSHTAVATVAAVELAGATPVLVDVDPDRRTLDPEALRRAVRAASGGRPAAVIAVHLYGHPADLDAIRSVCAQYGLRLIEDCAQCHGATLDGRLTGTMGDVSTFSFYPTKNLGAIGDGGAVATADPKVHENLVALRQYGWRERYISDVPGLNTRLDEMQAAILRVKLPALDGENAARAAIAKAYDQALAGTDLIQAPPVVGAVGHVYHQYVVRTDRRDELAAHLKAHGIGSAIHYPSPVHLQPAYAGRTALGPGGLPVTEALARDILSLPMYPQLDENQVGRVCAALASFR